MRWITRTGLTIGVSLALVSPAVADDWNEQTQLTFSEPIMIPGATLAPGTYVFKLLDSRSNRSVVQVFSDDMQRLLATIPSIPTKRAEATGDVAVRFSPTAKGAPVALKGWFYPGSRYGHEFIYSDEQARNIAQREKTLVLSRDVASSDVEEGELLFIDATGRHSQWHGDEATMKEWSERQSKKSNDGKSSDAVSVKVPAANGSRESAAPVVSSRPAGLRLELDQIEDEPGKYVGQLVTVTGEVDDVLGPRSFRLDERNWIDRDPELIVQTPTDLNGLLRDGYLVTVTGTLRPLVRANGEAVPDAASNEEFESRPVLVANRIVGGNDDVALVIEFKNPATDANSPSASR